MKEEKGTNATKELCYAAVAVALLAVCSWVAIPIGSIPVTLQSLAVCLIAALLGAKRSLIAVLAYLLLGIVGIPVFAGFTGGIGKLLPPTGGYLAGFLLAAPLIGLLCKTLKKGFFQTVLAMSVGVLVCYAFGTAWLVLFTANTARISVFAALSTCVLPYLLPDVCKIAVAAFLTEKLRNKLPLKTR